MANNRSLREIDQAQPLSPNTISSISSTAYVDTPWRQAENIDRQTIAGIGLLMFIVLCFVLALMSLVRVNKHIAGTLQKITNALSVIAHNKIELSPEAADLALAIHNKLNTDYYSELVACVEQSLATRGYRFGTNRSSEVVLSFDILRDVSAAFTRSQVKFMRPSVSEAYLEDAVSMDYIDGYSDKYVRSIIDAARVLGRYVEPIPGYIPQPQEQKQEAQEKAWEALNVN